MLFVHAPFIYSSLFVAYCVPSTGIEERMKDTQYPASLVPNTGEMGGQKILRIQPRWCLTQGLEGRTKDTQYRTSLGSQCSGGKVKHVSSCDIGTGGAT